MATADNSPGDPRVQNGPGVGGLVNGRMVNRWADKFGPVWALVLLLLVMVGGLLTWFCLTTSQMVAASGEQIGVLRDIKGLMEAQQRDLVRAEERDKQAATRDEKILTALMQAIEARKGSGPGDG